MGRGGNNGTSLNSLDLRTAKTSRVSPPVRAVALRLAWPIDFQQLAEEIPTRHRLIDSPRQIRVVCVNGAADDARVRGGTSMFPGEIPPIESQDCTILLRGKCDNLIVGNRLLGLARFQAR